MIPLYFLLNPL